MLLLCYIPEISADDHYFYHEEENAILSLNLRLKFKVILTCASLGQDLFESIFVKVSHRIKIGNRVFFNINIIRFCTEQTYLFVQIIFKRTYICFICINITHTPLCQLQVNWNL